MSLRTFAEPGALLGAAVAALTAATSAAAQPSSYNLAGVVRDFRRIQPDFNMGPAAVGHYAGNVNLELDPAGRPAYTGGGFKVSTEWTDPDGRNIAPHLVWTSHNSCFGRAVGVTTKSNFYISNTSEIYGYRWNAVPPGGVPALITTNSIASASCEVVNNSDVWGDVLVGPGGDPYDVVKVQPNGEVHGMLGNLAEPVTMPTVTAPGNLGPSVGNRTYSSGLLNEISTNLHVNALTITGSARVTIRPGTHVTILADGDVVIDANGSAQAGLYIGAGASLDLYVNGELRIASRAEAVDFNPSVFRVYMLYDQLAISGNAPARLRAKVFAPESTLVMTQGAQFYGAFWGSQINLDNSCRVYLDMSVLAPEDTAGVAGPAGGGIQSAASFAAWFDDVLTQNASNSHNITMTRDFSGVYEYLDDTFYPVDGLLFGNEGETHNNNFTYAIDATFTYSSCAGQFVEFTGADDLWLFIDDSLVMDLGGVRAMTPQHLDLDRLDLTDGLTYSFKLFYAQRNSAMSRFNLRTNLELASTPGPVSISSAFD